MILFIGIQEKIYFIKELNFYLIAKIVLLCIVCVASIAGIVYLLA